VKLQLGPRAQAALLLALVGTLGMLVGVLVGGLAFGPRLGAGAGRGQVPPAVYGPGPRREGGLPLGDRLAVRPRLDRLADELELSARQRAQIDSIMRDEQAKVRELFREFRPRFEAVVQGTRRRIDSVLTPEQRERLRALSEERRGRRGHRLPSAARSDSVWPAGGPGGFRP
jgi:hypothetical protein